MARAADPLYGFGEYCRMRWSQGEDSVPSPRVIASRPLISALDIAFKHLGERSH
jgi:hypothetical protein